jgi:hypothetical protein
MEKFKIYIYKVKEIIHRVKFFFDKRGSKVYQWVPFDISKPLPKNADKFLINIIRLIKIKEIEGIRVSDGTLLGYLRNGRLIDHDNDIDFDVLYSKNNIDKIKNIAKQLGLIRCREVIYKRRIQQLTYYDKNEIIYDFIFWNEGGKFLLNYSEPGYVRIMPDEFLRDLKKCTYGDLELEIPVNSLQWLEFRYGKSWSMPKKYKGDWKDECGDLFRLWY